MRVCKQKQFLSLLLFFVSLGSIFSYDAVAQECELNCKGQCSPEGECMCDLPDPDSILMGDRQFMGGVFCDVESVMCDGTNSFWCENGGTCNELVQGESYSCTCPLGFAGERCNLTGELCVDTYCFNGGLCHNIGGVGTCECPLELSGSPNCSLPTATAEEVSLAPTMPAHSKRNRLEWWVIFTAVFAALSVCCVGGLALKCLRHRASKRSQLRFHELQQLHLNDGQDFLDDGEDDAIKESKVPRKGFP